MDLLIIYNFCFPGGCQRPWINHFSDTTLLSLVFVLCEPLFYVVLISFRPKCWCTICPTGSESLCNYLGYVHPEVLLDSQTYCNNRKSESKSDSKTIPFISYCFLTQCFSGHPSFHGWIVFYYYPFYFCLHCIPSTICCCLMLANTFCNLQQKGTKATCFDNVWYY